MQSNTSTINHIDINTQIYTYFLYIRKVLSTCICVCVSLYTYTEQDKRIPYYFLLIINHLLPL